MNVEAFDGSDAAVTEVAVPRDHDRGDTERIDEAGRRDTNHTTMPSVRREHDAMLRTLSIDVTSLRKGFLGHALGNGLSLLVLRLDFLEQRPSLLGSRRHQEAKGEIRAAEPAGRIQPR